VDAVLFDFDLTLADSSAAVAECANFALRSLALAEAEPAAITRTIGLTLADSFRSLTGVADPALAAAYARRFIERADEVMADLTVLYPSVPTVLRALRERRTLTGIVSTKFRYRIEEILRRADSTTLVDAIVGGEDVTHHKPDPSGIRAALSRLNVRSGRAVYVGDHPVDAVAARAAGVSFIGVLSGVTERTGFAEIDAHEVIGSVAELPDYLAARYPAAT